MRGWPVPAAAVLEEDGLAVVYVKVGGEAFQRRVVELGPSDGSWTIVAAGVESGEQVVTTGAYQVKLASLGRRRDLPTTVTRIEGRAVRAAGCPGPAGPRLAGAPFLHGVRRRRAPGGRGLGGRDAAGRRLPDLTRPDRHRAHRCARARAGRGGEPGHLPGRDRRERGGGGAAGPVQLRAGDQHRMGGTSTGAPTSSARGRR